MGVKDLPVFKTMVDPDPRSIPNLTGWREPTTAYVLLEVPQLNITHGGAREWGMGLATVNAESRAEVMNSVEAVIKQGGRILHYAHFPSFNDPDPKRREKAVYYSQGGSNSWDNLEAYVRRNMHGSLARDKELAVKDDEINALKAKLAAMQPKGAEKIVAVKEEKVVAPKEEKTAAEKVKDFSEGK